MSIGQKLEGLKCKCPVCGVQVNFNRFKAHKRHCKKKQLKRARRSEKKAGIIPQAHRQKRGQAVY